MTIKRSIRENVNSANNSFRLTLVASIIDLCKLVNSAGGGINFIRPVIVSVPKAKFVGSDFYSFVSETQVFTSISWNSDNDFFLVNGIGYTSSHFLTPDGLLAIYDAVSEVVRRTK